MDFDHLPGTDKVCSVSSFARAGKYSEQELIDEIAKCEVVCSNCHRQRTFHRSRVV